MKNNTYFEELERIGSEWTKAHEAHKKLKEQIIEEKGWDSEELKAWYAEEEQMQFPYSQGACKAYRAWKYSTTDEILLMTSSGRRTRMTSSTPSVKPALRTLWSRTRARR